MVLKTDKISLNSLLVAIYIAESIACSMIDSIIHIPNISVVLMILLLLLNFIVNKIIIIDRIKKGLEILIVIETILFISGLINGLGYISSYSIHLIAFGFTAMILSFNDIDSKIVIKILILIYTVYDVMYFLIIRKKFLTNVNYYGQSMGIAYTVSVSIYILFLVIFFSKEYRIGKIMRMLAGLNSLVAMFIILIDCQSRGPLVAVIIAAVIFYLAKRKKNTKIFYVILVAVVGIVQIYYFKTIIYFISDILKSTRINVGAIDKFIYLYDSGIGVGNGREFYYEKAIEAIKSNLLTGHGVGYFEAFVNGEYVHNIFLDLLVSFGIIGFAIAVYFIFYKPFIYFFKNFDRERTGYILFIFCIGELMLNFSGSYWLNPSFWYMFFFYLQDENKVLCNEKHKGNKDIRELKGFRMEQR